MSTVGQFESAVFSFIAEHPDSEDLLLEFAWLLSYIQDYDFLCERLKEIMNSKKQDGR